MSNRFLRDDDSDDEGENDNYYCNCFRIFKVSVLITCFVLGTSIGIYLLVTEDLFRFNYTYNIVPNVYSKHENTSPDLQLPVAKVIVTATDTVKCSVKEGCAMIVQNGTNNDVAMLNNFLIDGDGKIFEGLGWQQPCKRFTACDNSTISVAFIGNFKKHCPAKSIVQTVINFLQSSQRNSKIKQCFMTTVDLSKGENWSKMCLIYAASDIQEITKKFRC